MRLFSFSSSSSLSSKASPAKEQGDGVDDRTPVYLNIYDLSAINNYIYWFGLGVYHSGIEAHGMEFGFGGHEYSFSGVFEVEPKKCPGFIFRRSMLLGDTNMPRSEFRSFMQDLAAKYHGDTYHLIAKNCNHFTDEACMQLTGKPIPGWVNRLAKVGSLCNCFLPVNIQVRAVRQLPDQSAYFVDDDNDDDYESDSAFSATAESEIDEPDQQLLSGDLSILREKMVSPAKESL